MIMHKTYNLKVFSFFNNSILVCQFHKLLSSSKPPYIYIQQTQTACRSYQYIQQTVPVLNQISSSRLQWLSVGRLVCLSKSGLQY